MARRVARGLFRVWLVVSVMWICAAGAVTWWATWDPWGVVSETPPDWAKPEPGEPGPHVLSPDVLSRVQTTAEIALIPPALTLVFGAALGWAIRGFRD